MAPRGRELKASGKIRAFGISVNRWEPENVLRALATGLVDAVQVVYNVFDQSPEDVLFPACQRAGIAVIARVPFDEGSLTGTLRADSRWPEGDWRNTYFAPAHLAATLPRVERVREDADAMGMSLPELALRFILSNPTVTTTIPACGGRNMSKRISASATSRLWRPVSSVACAPIVGTECLTIVPEIGSSVTVATVSCCA
jgi:aryl-alcohol dehydrogenase-like predicted oxidoreductase